MKITQNVREYAEGLEQMKQTYQQTGAKLYHEI